MDDLPSDKKLARYSNFACDVASYVFIVGRAKLVGTAAAREQARRADAEKARQEAPDRQGNARRRAVTRKDPS